MKVNLLLNNPGDIRSGYINIDGAASVEECQQDGRVSGRLDNLEHTIDANELDELVAMGILDHFPMKQADEVLDHWLSRLKHGGILTVSVTDLRQVARELLDNTADIADINKLLYGEQEQPWQYKYCVFTTSILTNILRAKGYEIVRSVSTSKKAVVTVRRP